MSFKKFFKKIFWIGVIFGLINLGIYFFFNSTLIDWRILVSASTIFVFKHNINDLIFATFLFSNDIFVLFFGFLIPLIVIFRERILNKSKEVIKNG